MSTLRKFGVLLCIIGFFVVCALALTSTLSRPFAGMQGIQDDLAQSARSVLDDAAPNAVISADGRDLKIDLSDVQVTSFDREAVRSELASIEGVRNVEFSGEPTIGVPIDEAPAPRATETPDVSDDDEPADEPATEPSDEPDAEPTDEPAVEPTAAVEPSLSEIVEGLDLSTIEFEPGTAELTAADQATLDEIAVQLQGQTGDISVQVHTDNVGDPDVNLLLSQDRAISIAGYLMSQGVDGDLLTPQGFGASQPIADNSTEQGRAANRRVALVVEGN